MKTKGELDLLRERMIGELAQLGHLDARCKLPSTILEIDDEVITYEELRTDITFLHKLLVKARKKR